MTVTTGLNNSKKKKFICYSVTLQNTDNIRYLSYHAKGKGQTSWD